MGRPKVAEDSVQITFRIEADWEARADAIARRLDIERPGLRASRTDAFRTAIARGFEILEAELPKAKTKKGNTAK